MAYQRHCPDWEIERSAGSFTDREAAIADCVRILSHHIDRCPDSKRCRVYFRFDPPVPQPRFDPTGYGGAVWYVREFGWLGFEQDPHSGFVYYWTNISAAQIHAMASTNGLFSSLGPWDWPPESTE